jgi:hypothetical protein
MDGYRASIEVPRKDVTLTKPIVEDVDDNVFSKNPDDAPPPRVALLDPEPVEEEPNKPKPRRKQRTTKETEQV